MQVQFISSFSVITPSPPESRKLYVDALGLPLNPADETAESPEDGYVFSSEIGGSKHFGVWPLAEAAEACFGTSEWPSDHPVPQASVEFDVESEAAVSTATAELAGRGYAVLHAPRTEPWGQTVARIQSPEGLIVGVSYAPWMHEEGAGGHG